MEKSRIYVKKSLLNLKMMLEGGQCFRWKAISPNKWIGTVSNVVWTLTQFDDYIEYEAKGELISKIESSLHNNRVKGCKITEQPEEFLKRYLNLDAPLEKYYAEWSNKDPNFEKVSTKCYGIRILRQDPVENIFSFICSSNNNIKRISSLVEKLCVLYGQNLCSINGEEYYGFPGISELARSNEVDLRKAGFGYRAKFICQSAKHIQELGGSEWLKQLKECSYLEAKSQLMKLSGIGAKVADCICLMSLEHMESVPVDTHVYQIASNFYMPHLRKVKNLTDKIYNEIGDFFRELYGPLAGWAHTVLFCGDLKAFKDGGQNDKENVPKVISANKKIAVKKKDIDLKENVIDEKTKCVSGILPCARRDLHLRITLISGQTYRFKEIKKDVWRGVFANKVWTLSQFDDRIEFQAHFKSKDNYLPNKKRKLSATDIEMDKKCCEDLLKDYFRLDISLASYYKRWSESDEHFKAIADKFYGLRMIKQDAVENLFAFICSSCNSIDRMTSMVETMCSLYGEKIAVVDGIEYKNFPTVYKLSLDSVEEDLKKASFGYRAKFINKAAKYIGEKGSDLWIENLKKMSYENAKSELMILPGIGAKVADCICLTALDHLEAIPVDTHVFQLAQKYYLPELKNKKTVTEKTYKEIGDCFRKTFGHLSGWAHTVLFSSELKQHKELYN